MSAALAAALVARPARAHGVVSEVERHDGAVAVRLRYHDGPPLADAPFEVRSPRGGDAAFAEGRTDRHGWVAFTPDAAGIWKVRIVDASGHGKVVDVKVEAVAEAAPPAPAAGAPSPRPSPPGAARGGGEIEVQVDGKGAGEDGGSGRTLRVLAGATAIVVVFRLLLALQRSRRAKVK